MSDSKNIDEYISRFPEDVQERLNKLRQVIRGVAPNAKETISYRMPTFKLNGNLVHFAAFRKSWHPTILLKEPYNFLTINRFHMSL